MKEIGERRKNRWEDGIGLEVEGKGEKRERNEWELIGITITGIEEDTCGNMRNRNKK